MRLFGCCNFWDSMTLSWQSRSCLRDSEGEDLCSLASSIMLPGPLYRTSYEPSVSNSITMRCSKLCLVKPRPTPFQLGPFWVAFTCTNRPSGARISWVFSPSGNRSRPNTVDTIASPMSPINFPSKLNGHSGKASARMFCAEYNVCSASEMGVGLWCFIFLRNSFISRTVEGASLDSSVQSVNVEQGTFVCRSAIKPHSFASLNSQSE